MPTHISPQITYKILTEGGLVKENMKKKQREGLDFERKTLNEDYDGRQETGARLTILRRRAWPFNRSSFEFFASGDLIEQN